MFEDIVIDLIRIFETGPYNLRIVLGTTIILHT
jgi:hypothetical protein